MKNIKVLFFTITVAALFISNLAAQHSPGLPAPDADSEEMQKTDTYSPYAGRNFPTNVYWGDTHLHTGMSMDAGAFGARLDPENAYQFARGEELISINRCSRKTIETT